MTPSPSQFYGDSIFWVEVEKIKPNPFQPRKEFDEARLRDLADSVRQYGILQPLVVTRQEREKEDGGLVVEYELVAGERRLRASKIAGLAQVPVIIRSSEDSDRMKLELAIIENLQREDLNPMDRAHAFQRLVDEFGFKHTHIAQKIGKSREYVSNTLRLLMLPKEMQEAVMARTISEGHTRPLLMLGDRPEEQTTLFKEILTKKISVRDAEQVARRIAYDKIRKHDKMYDPEIIALEQKLADRFGTRVHIESKEVGGKIQIDFFSDEDLRNLLSLLNASEGSAVASATQSTPAPSAEVAAEARADTEKEKEAGDIPPGAPDAPTEIPEEKKEEETESPDLYSIRNFSI